MKKQQQMKEFRISEETAKKTMRTQTVSLIPLTIIAFAGYIGIRMGIKNSVKSLMKNIHRLTEKRIEWHTPSGKIIKNDYFVKRYYSYLILLFLLPLFVLYGCAQKPEMVLNPYENVNWDNAGRHKANFHTHTTQSDGLYPPHEVVDRYNEMGYSILAITDHDLVTYPWSAFADMRDGYENRDPLSSGMLSVVGNELSRHHHTLSLFSDFKARERDLDMVLTNMAAYSDDAIAVIAHPAMHWPRQFDTSVLTDSVIRYYMNYYSRHNNLIAMEIHNGTRPLSEYTLDRELWDELLSISMPDRPIWGFATDDMHSSIHYGRDWVVIPLEILTVDAVRQALIDGAFYFSSIRVYGGNEPDVSQTPVINAINHNSRSGEIMIQASINGLPMDEQAYSWISGGEVVFTGSTINYRSLEGLGNYIRAEITGNGGITYTNPFGFNNP